MILIIIISARHYGVGNTVAHIMELYLYAGNAGPWRRDHGMAKLGRGKPKHTTSLVTNKALAAQLGKRESYTMIVFEEESHSAVRWILQSTTTTHPSLSNVTTKTHVARKKFHKKDDLDALWHKYYCHWRALVQHIDMWLCGDACVLCVWANRNAESE